MIKTPKDLISIKAAARKYGFSISTLHDYIRRKRIEAVRMGWQWYTTHQAMRNYLKTRDVSRIPYSKSKK